MLAALLPILEKLAAEGGASALGGGEGIGASLSKLFGGVKSHVADSIQNTLHGDKPFEKHEDLGQALRKISDLHASIKSANEAMEDKGRKREEIANQARADESKFGANYEFGGRSNHNAQIADLANQQREHQREAQRQQREVAMLQARAAATIDPRLQASSTVAKAGLGYAAGDFVSRAGPSLLQSLPGVQSASNAFGFIGGQTNSAIAGDMAQTAAGGVSHVVGGAIKGASVGGMVAGPIGAGVGAVVGGVAAAAGDISKLPQNIVKWSEALLSSQQTLSRFSGTLTATFAEANRRGIVRAIESGQRTGGATSELSGSMQKLYDQLQPMKDAVTNSLGTVLTAGVKTLSQILTVAEKYLALTTILNKAAAALASIEKLMFAEAEKNKKPGNDIARQLARDIVIHDSRKPREVPRR